MKRLIGKRQLNVFIDDEVIDFVEGVKCLISRVYLNWSPLVGMLVQGLRETLVMIMIGMNLICVSKDCVK